MAERRVRELRRHNSKRRKMETRTLVMNMTLLRERMTIRRKGSIEELPKAPNAGALMEAVIPSLAVAPVKKLTNRKTRKCRVLRTKFEKSSSKRFLEIPMGVFLYLMFYAFDLDCN
jgi:hypothetical protein